MSPGNNPTKRELIIEVWEQLDCESVGARELAEIQQSVRKRFGVGAVESPAAIARLLADEGAVLRHPEVIDCDAGWRASVLAESLLPAAISFDCLTEAAAAIKALDEVRQELEADSRQADLASVFAAAKGIRKDRLLLAHSKVVKEEMRREASEIAEWLRVWLEAPDLFADWLDLRQRSGQFIERFGDQSW